ncbi:MAG: carbon-nitrogen hydrolase [Epsilonproteobacteria bacterium]|nr:carbon-nitrogen hydrolase [Campylobacterota bacterium]
MKIGVVQQKYHGSKILMLEATVTAIKALKAEGAELVVLQELHQDRYFCVNENVENFMLAESYEEDVAFWAKVAKESSVVLVVSLFEKRAVGLYHNSAIVFEKDGSIAGKYRKMHIPDDPGFYEKFYFTPGDLGFEPIETSVGKLGVLICWDQWFPEAARLMTLKGADILIYPTAIGWFDEDCEAEKARQLDAWMTVQRGHAIANGVPVVAINRIGKELDDAKVIDGIRFWGNSFVVDAQGAYLYRGSKDKEEAVLVDIDTSKSEEIRRIWPFLRDRRIDAYEKITYRFID